MYFGRLTILFLAAGSILNIFTLLISATFGSYFAYYLLLNVFTSKSCIISIKSLVQNIPPFSMFNKIKYMMHQIYIERFSRYNFKQMHLIFRCFFSSLVSTCQNHMKQNIHVHFFSTTLSPEPQAMLYRNYKSSFDIFHVNNIKHDAKLEKI